MNALIEVGDIVRGRHNPEWGDGQVQSIIDGKVTVTFEHAGKLVLTGGAADNLIRIEADWR